MKRVTAYVNTMRVHWLVEELMTAGVKEVRVIEHFAPTSQISRLQLCCADELVDVVQHILRKLGTVGPPPDVDIVVSEFDPSAQSRIPLGQRMSALEEPQLAHRIVSLFKGSTSRLTAVFLGITLSICAVGLLTHVKLARYEERTRASILEVGQVESAAQAIQTAHLDELLAAERLHRGEGESALRDFRAARDGLSAAVATLQSSHRVSGALLDSLIGLESRFESLTDGMFGVLSKISALGESKTTSNGTDLTRSHADLMAVLDRLHTECMNVLGRLEESVSATARTEEQENSQSLDSIRLSLTVLAAFATAVTLLMWLVAQRKVNAPLHVLVEEARALDDEELK